MTCWQCSPGDAVWYFIAFVEIPPEFSGPNAGYGVVALWTRRAGAG